MKLDEFISVFLLFILIIIFAFCCKLLFNFEFAKSLPLFFCYISLVSFILGILGLLKISSFIIVTSIILLFLILIIKNKKEINVELCRSIFNFDFLIFTVIFLFLLYCNFGMLCSSWDEFSHWADVVKAMTYYDDFSTNPILHSAFQSYPPAMSLVLYFIQKLDAAFISNYNFIEWHLFFTYQLFYISFIFPILNKVYYKQFYFISVLILPLYFSFNIYNSIYIDNFLSVVSASGLILLILYENKDHYLDLYIPIICSILVLSKDVGIMFALIIAVCYIFVSFNGDACCFFKTFLSTTLSIFVPKCFWNFSIKKYVAEVAFNEPIIVSDIYNIILGKDSTYRQKVYNRYFDYIFNHGKYTIPFVRIDVSYAFLFFAAFAVLIIFYFINKKSNKKNYLIFFIIILESIIYVFGMCFIYIFKFSEYEAMALASVDRYINIIVLQIIYILLSCLFLLIKSRKVLYLIMLIFIILDIYVYSVLFHKVVDKSYINSAIEYRDKYSEITDIINKNVIKNEKILLVSQEDIGYDYWTIRFILRPAYVECDGLSWSFSNDIKENDYYSINISARDFLNRLLENEYDYVLLFRINDYFAKEYKYLFTDETKILENRIYRLDKDIKKLVLCD